MKVWKGILLLIVLVCFAVFGLAFYAFKIEPYRLKTNIYDLNENREDTALVKVVQISDLHIKQDFTHMELRKVVDKVNAENPDIVLFTGDLYDNYAKYQEDESIISELGKIKAKYGKIAIWGNRDYGGGAVRTYESVMEQSGFTLLKNENLTVAAGNDKKIEFTGMDDFMLGGPYMPDAGNIRDSDYRILMMHEPDAALEFENYDYDVILSGHSHGGQINIPFLPDVNEAAVSLTALSENYSGGMYTLNGGTGMKMYVNTGIGTTHISARFGVVPEIAVFNIYL